MKIINNIHSLVACVVIVLMNFAIISCDDNYEDTNTGFLSNPAISMVKVLDNNRNWTTATQAKVGSTLRLEGGNLDKVTSIAFNGLDIDAAKFLRQGVSYIEIVIPQNTPLGHNVEDEALRNTILLISNDKNLIYPFDIVSWKFNVRGIRCFKSEDDIIGEIVSEAAVGSEIQIEGAGLDLVSKISFNGLQVASESISHIASTAIGTTIPKNTPLNDENKIILETELGETYNYTFRIIGPQISIEDAVFDSVGNRIAIIQRGTTVILKGENLNIVKELYCNGSQITGFIATESSITIHIPDDLPVGENNVPDVNLMNTIKIVSDYSSAIISIKFAGNGAAPVINSVSHTMAKAGERIYIFGVNFEDVQSVTFPGNIEASEYTVIDSKTIQCTVPADGDSTPGCIRIITASGTAHSYNDINFNCGKFMTDFGWGDSYAGSSSNLTLNGVSLTMSQNQSAGFPVNNSEMSPSSPSIYRITPIGGPIDVIVNDIGDNGADLLKFYFKYSFWTKVIQESDGLISGATACSDLAIEFDFYMPCDWTMGAWRWETGKNSTDGDGRLTLLPWSQEQWKFYGGWRTLVIPLAELSCFDGYSISDIMSQESFNSNKQSTISFKIGSFRDTDGKYVKGTDMKGYQLAFGNFRLVTHVKPKI